ncbi:MAG: outer membrane beta-barrel protein [Candidatus Thiothrix moscowensis]|nr:outer membrane beta-barrel protein [Candidatus Thiothrix moscowensis]
MISPKLSGITALLLCAMSANTFAAESSAIFTPIGKSASKPDNYLGGSIGQSSADGFCDALQNCEDTDQSWKLFGGVRVNETFVVEGGYINFGDHKGQDAGTDVSRSTTAAMLAGVAGIPVNEEIELFGKAGIARWSQERTDASGKSDSKGTNLMMGAGANYDLGDNMGIRAEWERFKDIGDASSKGDVDLLSVGVTFSSL